MGRKKSVDYSPKEFEKLSTEERRMRGRLSTLKRIWSDNIFNAPHNGIRANRAPSALDVDEMWSRCVTYQQFAWISSDISAICLDLVQYVSHFVKLVSSGCHMSELVQYVSHMGPSSCWFGGRYVHITAWDLTKK